MTGTNEQALSMIKKAVNRAQKAKAASDWFKEHSEGVIADPTTKLTVKLAAGCPGFHEADMYLQRAFIAALPNLFIEARKIAVQEDAVARDIIKYWGERI